MRLADDYGGEHPYVESRTEAWLSQDLSMHKRKSRRTVRGLGEQHPRANELTVTAAGRTITRGRSRRTRTR
jgi:hypothetical protein